MVINKEQLNRFYQAIRSINGYQTIMKKVGFSDEILDLVNEWEDKEFELIERLEKEYNKGRKEQIEKLREFRKEIDGTDMRISYLKSRKKEFELKISEANQHNKEMKESFFDIKENLSWLRLAIISLYNVPDLNREIKKIDGELNYLESKNKNSKTEINDEMIERAKEYPFENLVDLNRSKFILCPFHDDSKPSFFIKNNFGFCFSCGKSADTIDFVMQTRSLTFIEAVKSLQ